MRKFDIEVCGIRLCEAYTAVIENIDIIEPEEKLHLVDCGGDGVIDLTEALTGEVKYGLREINVSLAFLGRNHQRDRDSMRRMLKGKVFDFSITTDPGFTYTNGRFVFKTQEGDKTMRRIDLSITCDPYKLKRKIERRVNANGGLIAALECGMRTTTPVFESKRPLTISKDGFDVVLPPGSHKAYDIQLFGGINEIYLSTRDIYTVKWSDLTRGSDMQDTWRSIRSKRWFELQRARVANPGGLSWNAACSSKWKDVSEKTWYDLAYQDGRPDDCEVIISYEWRDL